MPSRKILLQGLLPHLNAHVMAHTYHTTFHTENAILHGIYHVMNEMRLLMPITRVLTDSLTHANAKCEKTVIGVSPNDSFLQTKIFLFLKLKTHWKILQCPLISSNPCVYTFVGHGFSSSHHRMPYVFSTFLWSFIASDHV